MDHYYLIPKNHLKDTGRLPDMTETNLVRATRGPRQFYMFKCSSGEPRTEKYLKYSDCIPAHKTVVERRIREVLVRKSRTEVVLEKVIDTRTKKVANTKLKNILSKAPWKISVCDGEFDPEHKNYIKEAE